MRQSRSLSERLWAKVNKDGPIVRPELGPCHEWTGALNDNGYGIISLGGRKEGTDRVHRVAWRLEFGEIPDGVVLLHGCDNRKCVRTAHPSHLTPGTHQDNSDDKYEKGRASPPPIRVGASNHRARLIELGGVQLCIADWAKATGLCPSTIKSRLNRGWSAERALQVG